MQTRVSLSACWYKYLFLCLNLEIHSVGIFRQKLFGLYFLVFMAVNMRVRIGWFRTHETKTKLRNCLLYRSKLLCVNKICAKLDKIN